MCFLLSHFCSFHDNITIFLKIGFYLYKTHYSHINQKTNANPSVRRKLRSVWACKKKQSIMVPWDEIPVFTTRPSMLSIYGVSQGFNHHSLVLLTDLFLVSGQGFDA
jgi:hypothetical protein